jgi:RNA polymerase sigma-70 factor (ECF subfamily)
VNAAEFRLNGAKRAAAQIRSIASRITRARKGDRTALAELLDEIADRVLTLCHRLLDDRTEAEDAAQEAMIKVSLHLHELKHDDQFVSWCWRIAHRICVDRLRTTRRRDHLLAERKIPVPEDREGSIVRRMAVRQILSAMPEDMSEVLVLREMEGQTYREIAAGLALPIGTVRSRLSAARKRFRRDYLRATQERV